MSTPSKAPNRTPKDAPDPRPHHERIATDLRRKILTGQLQAGDKLPSNPRLAEDFGVAGATIQKAMTLLKDEGLVQGRAGAAVTVQGHRRQVMHPASFSQPAEQGGKYRWLEEAEKRGQRPTIELRTVAEVVASADIANALGLNPGERVVLREQLLSLDGEPCELVRSHYPLELARGTALADGKRIKGGSPTLLSTLGYPPIRTIDRVSAEEPTQEEYVVLHLPRQVAVLRTFRIVLSTDDRPIEATVMAKAGHMYELQYEF
jgi:GntR family transcriptional regulator